MVDATLVQAFHAEMRKLAVAYKTGGDNAADQYFAKAEGLVDRFNAAEIGDWNQHLELSGARRIFAGGPVPPFYQ